MNTYKVVLNDETTIVNECTLEHAKNVKAIYGPRARIVENIKVITKELRKAFEETKKYASGESETSQEMITAWNATGDLKWSKMIAIYNESDPFSLLNPTIVSKESAWDNCFEYALRITIKNLE